MMQYNLSGTKRYCKAVIIKLEEERWFVIAFVLVSAVYLADGVLGTEVHGLIEILKVLSWIAVLYQALEESE